MRILVVDDEPHIVHMLRFLFEKRGHDVLVATNGDDALETILDEAPEVVFLDLNLPGRSGFEVCEAVRAHDGFQDLPIFMLTAQGQEIDKEHGMAAGATDYITKPFVPSNLAKLVENLENG